MTPFHRKVFVPVALVLLILIAAPLYAGQRKITKHTLDNGLTVILEEDHSAPVVAFQMWVRVGSADERDDEAGIAHVFEHMLFKGTDKRGVGQIAREINAAGGYINAYTSFDNTVYHLAVASRYFSTGLDIMSDAIQRSSFDPVELEKELEVVHEELRMGEDSPARKLYKTVFSTAYTSHPYRRPVIGYEDTVKGLTREKILDFFKRWYIPNNMTLVVVGDFDTEKALDAIRESFAGFERRPDPHVSRPAEPRQTSIRTVITPQSVSQTHMAMAFHIPELKSEDTYALDVLANILGGGVTSRLYRRLKMENELVYSVSSYAMTPKDPGLFLILTTLDAEKAKKTTREITDELVRLSIEGVGPDELERAKTSLESDFIYARETMQGKARQLGYYETVSGDLAYEKRYIDGIRSVTPDDIKDVVGRYLVSGNMTLAVVVPQGQKGIVNGKILAMAVKKAEKKARRRYKKKARTSDVTKVKLENGITLLVKEDHSNQTVALYATFPGGLRVETSATNGIGAFTAGMLTRGTHKRTREELAREVEGMAGSISGFSGKNSAGVSAKFLSRFFDRGLDLFADVVMNPSFPEEEMERLRKDILAAIRREKDYLPGYTFKLLNKKLYKTHPYGMPVNGTEKTISAFTVEDLRRHYQRIFVPERMVLSIVGDINTGSVIEQVRKAFGEFDRKAMELPVPTAEEGPSEVIRTGAREDKAQTHIGIGFLGPRITDKDLYAMRVLTRVLSAHGGRLFVELRDKQSLAYAVSAFTRPGVEPGVFGVYIGCAPEKKDRAIGSILKELERIRTEKVTEEELRMAKNALIGNYEMGLQEVSSQASDMATNELLGLGYDLYRRYAEEIEKVTAEDVLEAARKYITLDRYVISVVGPGVDL